MRYVTASEMKEIDRRAIEDYGIPAEFLMENAGRAVAEEAMKVLNKGTILVLCGYGNNGGDGLVAARHLLKKGYDVKVFFAGPPKSFTPEANSNLESLLTMKAEPKFISKENEIEKIFGKAKHPALIIDAIFGTGMKGPLDDFYVKLIETINSLGVPVIAADIPSGLDADSGRPLPVAVRAVSTVTFGYPKTGFRNPEAAGYVGRLVVADIGFPKGAIGEYNGREGQEKGKKEKEKTIRLRTGKSGVIRSNHPWIFGSKIQKAASGIKPGDIVTVQTAAGKFVGRGYYNPKSEISIRLLTFEDETIDRKFFFKRFREALAKREAIFSGRAGLNLPYNSRITNAFRAIFSEADGLPGLIVDIYKDTAVFQALTLGMEKLKPFIVETIRGELKPEYIYEKSVSPFRKKEGLADTQGWHGPAGVSPVEIFEGRAKFLVDIVNGHKTGFYLDQRKSRLGLEGFCKDKTVLDLFCYTGGFSMSAGMNGARSVTGVDIKEDWLELARENARINGGVAEKSEFIKADAFIFLKEIFDSGRKFDIIILDPPSFLKNRESLASASKGYEELNTLAMNTLTDGGMLATFSCSHNMPNEAFAAVLKRSAEKAGKKTAILKRCHQAEDHPIVRAIPETEYLKGYFLKVGHP